MALEGTATAKITPTLAGFLQLQYKTSGNDGNSQFSIEQEGQHKGFTPRVALGVSKMCFCTSYAWMIFKV